MSEETRNRILKEMGSRGLKPAELARSMKVSRQTIHNYLKEDRPSTPKGENLKRMAEVFGVSEMYILHGREQEKVDYELLLTILKSIEDEAAHQDIELTNEQRAKLATVIYRNSDLVSGPNLAMVHDMVSLLT